MQRADELVLASLGHQAASSPALSPWTSVGRGALVIAVFLYLGSILLGPLSALLVETWDLGIRAAFASLWTAEAQRAFTYFHEVRDANS